MRNPVQLAWEAVTLHRLSGGRFELGIGAGHTPQEYAGTGIGLDEPRVRKQRLAESVEIISALFKAETVDHHGRHYRISGASVTAEPTAIPILVGGNGTALLSHAAAHADAIGLQGLGRIRDDGHRHRAKFGLDHLRAQLATIAAATTEDRPELAALVQFCEITEDREQALRTVLDRVDDLASEDAAATPYLAIGTVEEIARQVIKARDDWGISYFTTRSPEFGPVIARVRELEDGSSIATTSGNRPTGS
jgi:probable F420-dependent oxidoreductase